MSTELQRVAKAAGKVRKDRAELEEAIRSAKDAGEHLRDIATAAGLGLATIHRILNPKKENPS